MILVIMKKLFIAVKAWWKKVSEEAHRQKVLKHERNIKREALSRLQAREFEGEIYLCFDNVPIIQEVDLVSDLGSVLTDARELYLEYRLLNDGMITAQP